MKKSKYFYFSILSIIIFLFIITESLLYVFVNRLDDFASKKYPDFFKLYKKRKDVVDLDTFVMRSAVFDSDLGYDSEYGIIRGRTGVALGKRHFASTYGASFTYCDDVIFQHSWQYILENNLNLDVLNLAVAGYCTDQAYLKFLKYYESYPTDIVILGFLPTIFPHLVSVIDNFDYMLPKPRYVKKDGKLALYEFPFFKKREDLPLLKNKKILLDLMKYDDSYKYIKRYYGLDLVKGRQFPYNIEFFKMMIAKLRSWKENIKGPFDFIENKTLLQEIIKHIIDGFIEKSKQYDFFPIFLINYDPSPDENHKSYSFNFQKQVDYMRSKGIMVIEVKDIFESEISRGNISYRMLFCEHGGHYSYFANLIISKKLQPLFKLLKNKEYELARSNLHSILNAKIDYKEINEKLQIDQFIGNTSDYRQKDDDKIWLGSPINTGLRTDQISLKDKMVIQKAKETIKVAREFLSENKINPALQHYRKAISILPQWVELLNEYAWVLSTNENDYQKSIEESIYYAGLACEASRNINPFHLDTLAAAYAKALKFNEAAGIARIAYNISVQQNKIPLSKKILKRLKIYESKNYYIGNR